MKLKLKKISKHKFFVPFLVFLLTILPRIINLFGYPYFENDEGVYVSQAWWLVNFGKLAPYTYWYDHAPFGWLVIGLWQKLTFGPFTFGFSLFSGRILMVLLAGLTNFFIYRILNFLTKSKKISFIACLILALSPLAIVYQRRVLLDNIETFFLILCLWFFFKAKSKLLNVLLSALFFGLSFLSKESVIFLLPVMFYGLWLKVNKANRRFSLLIWFLTVFFLISLFPLIALLKGEFFPSGWFGGSPHVSLIETIGYQMGRGTGVSVWHPDSMFRMQIGRWFSKGFLIMFLGFWAVLINLGLNWKNKNARILAFLSLFYFIFLARGGLVLEFYILPLLSLFVLNIAFALMVVKDSLGKRLKFLSTNFIFVTFISLLSLFLIVQDLEIYTLKPAKKQLEAVSFIKANLNEDDFIIIDDFCFLDLRLSKNKDDKTFTNAEWFWKVEGDNEIRKDKLNEDWQNVDYILLSGEMRRKIVSGELPFVKEIFSKSVLVKDFPSEHKDEQGKIEDLSRRGDGWAALFKVEKPSFDDEGFSKFF
ncbi:ArnT family glycosyltransferase [Patescibacteria group bacterium]